MRQNAQPMTLPTDGSAFVILDPLEQSIKKKIETVGVPLRDWDVSINYGIKTGFNDAFIIDEQKRTSILLNCADSAERKRTDELIRPILRGRDIKRYGYEWGGLYLIATHNGIPEKGVPRVDIGDYQAVKRHLESHWLRIEKRSDQGDTPYHLRSCAYMEDFFKPKIIYPDIMRMPRKPDALDGYPYFYYDNQSFFVEATNFMMTGKDIDLVCSYLASDLGFYVFSKFYTGPQFDETGFRYKKAYLLNLVVPTLSKSYETRIRSEFSRLSSPSQFVHASVALNQLWYASIGLNSREIDAVTSYKSMLLEYSQRPFE